MTPWDDDDPRWDDDTATVPFGPPADETIERPPLRPTRGPGARIAAGVLVGVVGLSTLALVARATGGGDAPTCPDPPRPPAPSVQVVGRSSADPCPEWARYDRRTATLTLPDGRSFRLGVPGDVVFVGDWDCDREATPAIYRPSSGAVFQFAAWADGSPVSSSPSQTAVPRGRAEVVAHDGCDRLVVTDPT